MKLKRITSLVLAALMLLSSLASCADSEESAETDSAPSVENEEVTAEATENADEIDFSEMSFVERLKYSANGISDDLPEADYNGCDFLLVNFGTVEDFELTGEVVSDATYYQYLNTAERFNVKFVTGPTWPGDWSQYISEFTSWNMAGDHYADIVKIWNTSASEFMQPGYFTDLSQFSCIDTTKPWYFADEMKTYAYKGHTYLATGTLTTDITTGANVVFFNKSIQQDYNVEDLYTVVREGRWTLDYVRTLTADFYYDINGDGTKDDGDTYGFAFSPRGSWMSALATLECPQAYIDDEGNYHLSIIDNATRAEEVMTAMCDLINNTPVAASTKDWDGLGVFLSGNSLLGVNSLDNLTSLRDVEWSYGILPPWKYDENQTTYYTSYLPNPYAIPVSAPDKDMAAVIMTALSAEGYKQVLPAFYETAVKQKYSSDEESAEMLDLMFSNVTADAMFIYGNSSYIYNLFELAQSTNGYASYWKAKQKVLSKYAEGVAKALAELSDDVSEE